MKEIDGRAVSAFAEVFEAEAGVTKATDKIVTSNLDGVENAAIFSLRPTKSGAQYSRSDGTKIK